MLGGSVSEGEYYAAYKLFLNTLSSEQRLKILNLLRGGKMNVSELQDKMGCEQSVVSHNLRRLRRCGFIVSEVKGKYRYYKLNRRTILPMLNLIDRHMKGNCLKIIKGIGG